MSATIQHDGMLVTGSVLRQSRQQVNRQLQKEGLQPALLELATFEPKLVRFVEHGGQQIAGRLALTGAPTEVVQGVFLDIVQLTLIAVQAMRRGQYEYWKDEVLGDDVRPARERWPGSSFRASERLVY